MRSEQHPAANRHLHFGGVPVAEQPVSRKASLDRAEAGRLLCLAAGAADARRGINNQTFGLHQARIDQRLQRKDCGSRIAAGRGDGLRAPDRLAIELGDAVDELTQQSWSLVRVAVPALVGRRIVEAKIGT